MNGFEHYAVLASCTALVSALTVAVWLKTRQIAFVLGSAFLYYWSLYGAWSVIARGTGAGGQYRFEYLFEKLFPIYLDQYYVWTIVLYTVFIVTVQVTVLLVARSKALPEFAGNQISVDHRTLIIIASLLAIGAFAIVKDVLSTAISLGVNAYGVIGAIQANEDPSLNVPLFSLYQVLDETALGCLTLGLAILVSGDDARYIVGRPRRLAIVGYVIALTALCFLNLVLGNRSMLVFAILPSGLFYLANARRRSILVMAVCGVLAAAAIVVPGVTRSASAIREMSGLGLTDRVKYMFSESLSQQTESFAAHASMYGALSKHVPLTYGSSLLWLAESIMPRVIRPGYSQTIYDHYAAHVGAAANQGFTIHHATGWYLNFGVPGLLMGAILFGWIWAALMNRLHKISRYRSHAVRVFSVIAVWKFTGFIPILIRAGPEGYKGLFLEALLLPTLVLVAATMRLVLKNNRPWLAPVNRNRGWGYRGDISRLPSS
jgi:hypothetical protein